MKTSDKGIDFIISHEGCVLYAYDDFHPGVKVTHDRTIDSLDGTLTIGVGHTKTVVPGMEITEAEAHDLLMNDIKWAERAVEDLFLDYGWAFDQDRFDALVSWVFNTGAGNLESRSLIKAIDALNNAESEVDHFWNKFYITSKGVELPGLVRRRKEENDYFNHKIKE